MLNLIDALLDIASERPSKQRPTEYFLNGHVAYADEVFSAMGFLPLVARIAERRLARGFEGTNLRAGFSYLPHESGVFLEVLQIDPADDGTFADSERLSYLERASEDVLGMGFNGTIDLTQVYNFFMGFDTDKRNVLRETPIEELVEWPLYQPITF